MGGCRAGPGKLIEKESPPTDRALFFASHAAAHRGSLHTVGFEPHAMISKQVRVVNVISRAVHAIHPLQLQGWKAR